MSTMVAQPSASGSGISPREKMRVAKLALMADEDSEVNARRERRKSRRQSELGIMPGASPSTSDASSNSMSTPSSPSSIRSIKPTPPSCLHRGSSALDSSVMEYLAPPSPAPNSPLAPDPANAPDFTPLPAYHDLAARSMRRRSSRVRFAETPLPPANSTPPPTSESMRPASSIEGLRADLAIEARALSIPRRSSAASFSSSNGSDPFALQAFASPLSRLSQVTSNEDLAAFDPRPLPYPKVPNQLARVSMDVSSSTASSPTTSSPPLRELLDRPSVAFGPSPRHSYGFSARDPRESFASIASTLLDQGGSSGSSISCGVPRGAAHNSILPSQQTVEATERNSPKINRGTWTDDQGLSPRSGPSPLVEQEPVMQESAVIEPQRSERLDGIDLLPESDRPVEETSFESKHLRSESTPLLSIPLPPLRTPTLELSINRISVELEASVCDAASSLDTPRPDSNREELNLGPSSPQLKEMMRQTSRSGKGRGSTDRDGGEDSDLDISVPLLQVALKSRILSPSSRLLRHRPSPLRASSTSSTIRSQDEGWSGSESEEEDYARAIRIIALRKLSHPSTPTPSKPKRPSLEQSTSSRFSQLSQTSEASASTVDSGTTLLTPSSSVVSTRPPRLSSSRGPGDFPWGGSVPSSPTRQVSGLPTKGFYESMKSSPRNLPLREVEGWGPPEILPGDDWPSSGGETTPGSDMAEASPTVASNFRVPESGVRSTWGG